jgi:hypothetical protein
VNDSEDAYPSVPPLAHESSGRQRVNDVMRQLLTQLWSLWVGGLGLPNVCGLVVDWRTDWGDDRPFDFCR